MIGALPPGAIIAAQLAQPQQQPFTWGQGGRRLTPEDIARERQLAAQMTQVDYSPVASPWQGLARVSENVIGALRERKADKAAQSNADYSAQIAQSLLNPSGTPSGSAPAGANPPASAGNLYGILSDPYASDSVKAIAQMQLENQQKMAMKQFEYANREQPEIVQLSNIANDPTQPAYARKAARDRITTLNDPLAIIPDLGGQGTYVGPRSGIAGALGGGGTPDTLPPDFFDDPPPASAAPQAPNMIDQAGFKVISEALGGEKEARAFMQRNGLTLGGR